MKICECIDQLNRSISIYNTIGKLHCRMINVIINIDKDNAKLSEVKELLDMIKSVKASSFDYKIFNIIDDCFNNFNKDTLKSIKNNITDLSRKINDLNGYFNESIFTDGLTNKLAELLLTDNNFKFIWLYIDFLNTYTDLNLINDLEIKAIYKTCIDVKNKLWEYATSLELPTKDDWQFKNINDEKRRFL